VARHQNEEMEETDAELAQLENELADYKRERAERRLNQTFAEPKEGSGEKKSPSLSAAALSVLLKCVLLVVVILLVAETALSCGDALWDTLRAHLAESTHSHYAYERPT
jgi:cytochrome c-type biogenesis protein CcmH/NrfG